MLMVFFFFFQAEDGIRDADVTGVQTCALPISHRRARGSAGHRRAGRSSPPSWPARAGAGRAPPAPARPPGPARSPRRSTTAASTARRSGWRRAGGRRWRRSRSRAPRPSWRRPPGRHLAPPPARCPARTARHPYLIPPASRQILRVANIVERRGSTTILVPASIRPYTSAGEHQPQRDRAARLAGFPPRPPPGDPEPRRRAPRGARPAAQRLRRAAAPRQGTRPAPAHDRAGRARDDVAERAHPGSRPAGRRRPGAAGAVRAGRTRDARPPHRPRPPAATTSRKDPPARHPRALHRPAQPSTAGRRRRSAGDAHRTARTPLSRPLVTQRAPFQQGKYVHPWLKPAVRAAAAGPPERRPGGGQCPHPPAPAAARRSPPGTATGSPHAPPRDGYAWPRG